MLKIANNIFVNDGFAATQPHTQTPSHAFLLNANGSACQATRAVVF